MKQYIQKVAEGEHLTREEAASAMRTIMEGNATDAQISALLMGLKLIGEQPEEILGFVEVMREKAVRITLKDDDAIDMCGTGGDGSGTFNISTVASFVVAGAGVTVAKHGNRSISSACGSADILKALGVEIDLPAERVRACIDTVGIGFLYAPLFHPAMKHAAGARSALGVKTCFNMLGPMTNPAGVKRQLVGAFSRHAASTMAAVYSRLGPEKVLVVSSRDGLDEISLEAHTTVHDIGTSGSTPRTYEFDPRSSSLPAVGRAAIQGGNADFNARLALGVLKGVKGPHRDIVLANSAFGLLASRKADRFEDGLRLAEESVDSGEALGALNRLKEFTNQ